MRVGFLGFGEAASAIAAGLYEAGVTDIVAYDVAPGPKTSERLALIGRDRLSERAELAGCDVVFSAVTADTCVAAAESVAADLHPGQVYADLNSCSPTVKARVGRVVAASGALFAGVAVMSAVPPLRHRVPMLADGPGALALAERMAAYGMQIEVIPGDVGAAAAMKMFRSAIVKGMEALFLEALLPARRFGVDQRVLQSLSESFGSMRLGELGAYLLERHALHASRRAHELAEAADTIAEAGLEPYAVRGGAERLRWSAQRLADREGVPGSGYEGLLDALW
ncbi:MAG: NAD(P)-dependent oxidoreductase [Alicyclobacillaceae bacterium]|nr:NAD(P)-dependent oxidoreductase [Alicyclobacillaceae bacterium]